MIKRIENFHRFNEAEACAPRMHKPERPIHLPLGSFNEAEACAPRMPRATSPRPSAISPRFNEAEACAPRMPRVGTEGEHGGGPLASMRPRRVRLGCGRAARARPWNCGASMRPRRVRLGCPLPLTALPSPLTRFNEAEACAPRMLDGDAP